MFQKLVSEAGHQQEAVDVLLDRGRRYLHHRACITLEVDLDNLAFLWNAYTKQLFLLHDRLDTSLPDPDAFSLAESKENLHSTPVRCKRASKGTPERQHLPTTPDKHQLPAFSTEGNGIFHSVPGCENLNSSFAESDQSKVAQQPTPDRSNPDISIPDRSTPDRSNPDHLNPDRSTPDRSNPDRSNPDRSTPDRSHPNRSNSDRSTLDQSSTTDAAKKGDLLGSQPSNTELTRDTFFEGKVGEGEEKADREAFAGEASEARAREEKLLTPVRTRRVLPPTPRGGSASKAEEPGKQEEKATSETCGSKPSSPRSPRSKVLSASPWPGESASGWLKVAGEGIFTASPRPQRRAEPVFHGAPSPSDPGPCPHSASGLAPALQTQALTPPVSESLAATETCPAPVRRAGVRQTAAAAAATVEGLLGKRSKEIHNEQQQKQQQQQQQQSRGETQPAKQQVVQSDADGATKDETPAALQLQLGLTASEENLRMEIEEALKEVNGSLMEETGAAVSLTDFSMLDNTTTSKDTSLAAKASDNDSFTLDDLDLPTGPKRRRMNADTSSSVSSCSGSPLVSGDNSLSGTPSSSPAGTLRRDFKQRYRKDELWKAIESNYKYLMDKEIIETCQVGPPTLGTSLYPPPPRPPFPIFTTTRHYKWLCIFNNLSALTTTREYTVVCYYTFIM